MCWMLCSMISVETIRTRMCWVVAAHRGHSVILNQVCKLHTRLRTCGFPSIGPGEQEEVRRVQNDSDSDALLMQPVFPPDEARSRVGQRRVVLVNSPQPVPSAQVNSGQASVIPASSGAVGVQNQQNQEVHLDVPVVAMSGSEADADSIHAFGADEARDAVSDTESVGRDSDLRSVVPSEASSEPADEPGIREAANTRGFSVGLVQLDGFHVTEIFERRAHVMRVVPHFMCAAFTSAMKACEGILSGFSAGDLIRQERAWKLLFLLPRMLLCRPRRGGHVPKKELEQRLAMFNSGNWQELVSHSVRMAKHPRIWCEEAATTRDWRPELFEPRDSSAGRQALQSARVAPGTLATLRALTSPERRPPVPREPIPPHLASAVPESPFDLDFDRFVSNIRSAKRGAAPGPSGLTTEHLHPILENDSSLTALFRVGVLFSRGHVPPGALEALRLGRITALAKPDGGIRGIVVGDVLRRVVAKTIAQQIGDQVEKATAPFQFALKTRAGSECVAHTLRTLSELNEATTILSVDGVGAFDLISRSAMMQGLVDMPDGVKVLPFVRMFHGTPSQFLWEDELGTVNHIPQGEGGEQGDPLMPLLLQSGAAQSPHFRRS